MPVHRKNCELLKVIITEDAVSVEIATIVVSLFLLSRFCVSKNFVFRVKPVVKISIFRRESSFFSGNMSVPVVVRRNGAFPFLCLAPALWNQNVKFGEAELHLREAPCTEENVKNPFMQVPFGMYSKSAFLKKWMQEKYRSEYCQKFSCVVKCRFSALFSARD